MILRTAAAGSGGAETVPMEGKTREKEMLLRGVKE